MHAHTLDPKTLAKAANRGDKRMQPYRDRVVEAYDNMLGTHFGEKKSRSKRRPINLTAQMRMTMEPYLAFQFPRADVRALMTEFDFEAELHKLDIEDIADQLELGDMLCDVAIDALMGPVGILRMGVRQSYEAIDVDGQQVPLTYPFVSRISLDNYIPDPAAESDGEMLFEAHVNRFLKSTAVNQMVFGRNPDELDPSIDPKLVMTREEAARFIESMETVGKSNNRKVSSLTTSNTDDVEEGLQQIEVLDCVVYTDQGPYLAVMPKSANMQDVPDKYLLLEPYSQGGGGEGRRASPFVKLRFHNLPGSILGHPPEAIQRDLAEAMDEIATKTISRMKKQKGINIYGADGAEDAMAIRSAADEDWKMVNNVDNVGRVEQGDIPQSFYVAMGWISQTWNNVTGQLQLVSGQNGGGGDTATEYQGQVGRVQQRIQLMQSRVQKLCTKVFDHLGWWSCSNPVQERILRYVLPNGAPMNVPFSQAAGTKTGEYWRFQFTSEAYSMQAQSPEIQSARILDALDRLLGYAQAAPMLAAQGITVRLDEIAKLLRRTNNAPELERIFPTQQSMLGDQARQMVQQSRTASTPGPALGMPGPGGPAQRAVGGSRSKLGGVQRSIDVGRSASAGSGPM